MIFICLPAIDEHDNAALTTDHSIVARHVRSPSVAVQLVVCAILSNQQDMKHGIECEVDLKWIQNSMARTALYRQSVVVKSPVRLKETKDFDVVVVQP